MLRATFLCWQSWLLESEKTRILFDPILIDEIGRGPVDTRQTFIFWPPRRFNWASFPSIDAVVISHEHEDHFNIPSLARIDRSVPVFLSERSSTAARSIIEEMGFRLGLLYPGKTLRVGEIELFLFGPDDVSPSAVDEWDTLGYMARHIEGHGNFFTNVDIALTPTMTGMIKHASTLGSDHVVETISYERLTLGLWKPAAARPIDDHEMHQPPKTASFAFDGTALPALQGGDRILPLPGQSALLERGRLIAIEPQAKFLWSLPQSEWPPKASFWPDPNTKVAAIEPRCGWKDFPDEMLPELEEGLARLAEYLYGGNLFKRLYCLNAARLDGRKPTFVLILLADANKTTFAYEYQPANCAFKRVNLSKSFAQEYAGSVIFWASDLISLFRGYFEPRCIAGNVREVWHPACPNIRFQSMVLWPFFHPLRHPKNCLRQYRSILADAAQAPTQVTFHAH